MVSLPLLLLIFPIACILLLIISYYIRKVSHPQIPIVAYDMIGSKDGKPLVFIHGWPDLPSIWKGQIEYFKKDYLCINIALPNYKRDKIQNPWGYDLPDVVKGIANQIQYILSVKLAKYRQQGVTVVAHDWGSGLAQKLIVSYPELVSHAAFVDIGDSMPMNGWKDIMSVCGYQGFNIFCFLLPSFIGTKLMRYCLYKVSDNFAPIPIVESEKKQKKKLMHSGMNYLYFYMWRMLILSLITGQTKKLKMPIPKIPTFFVCGKSELGPCHSKKWKQSLLERDECEYKQYENAKHWVQTDECDKFNKELEKWLEQFN